MEFKAAKCSSCGGDLQLPTDKERVKCMYCGNDVVVKQAIAATAGINPTSVRELSLAAYQSKNFESTLQKWDQILSLDSNNAEAWFYRGITLLQMAESCSLWKPEVFKLVAEKVGIKETGAVEMSEIKRESEPEIVTLFKGTMVCNLQNGMVISYWTTEKVEIVGEEGDNLIVENKDKMLFMVRKNELL